MEKLNAKEIILKTGEIYAHSKKYGNIPEEDRIKSPNHYKLEGLNVESKDVAFAVIKNIKNQKIAVCIFNVLKYVIRAEKKNGLEDYKKAQEYLSWAIEEREVEENGNRENRTEKI